MPSQSAHGQHGADPLPLQHVAGEVQPPHAVAVPKGVGVDGEPLVGREVHVQVAVRADRVVGHRHPQVVPGVTGADRVVHPPAAVGVRDLRSPEVGAQACRRDQRTADAAPVHEVLRPQHLEHPAVDAPSGADGDVAVVGPHHEGVGEVAVVDGVAVLEAHARMVPRRRAPLRAGPAAGRGDGAPATDPAAPMTSVPVVSDAAGPEPPFRSATRCPRLLWVAPHRGWKVRGPRVAGPARGRVGRLTQLCHPVVGLQARESVADRVERPRRVAARRPVDLQRREVVARAGHPDV